MTAPKACCAIGKRPDAGAINAALRNHMNVRDVASLYGIGKTLVGDHRKNCLRLPDARPRKSATDGPDLVPVDVLDEVRRETSADKRADSGQARGQPESRAPRIDPTDKEEGDGESHAISAPIVEAPRARHIPHAKDAKTFLEQSLVCADMIAKGVWEGRPSVRWLSALWGMSVEAVRDRHRAGEVAAKADRGHIDAERQNAIGALQEQERLALDAYEESKTAVDEEGNLVGGDAKLLAVAVKARTEIARIAGCIPQTGSVTVNVLQSVEFKTAQTQLVDTVYGACEETSVIAERAAAQLGEPVSARVASAVMDALMGLLAERMRPKQLVEASGGEG